MKTYKTFLFTMIDGYKIKGVGINAEEAFKKLNSDKVIKAPTSAIKQIDILD